MKDKYDMTEQLKSIAGEEIGIPSRLSESTAEMVVSSIKKRSILPIVMTFVFAANILVSLLFGGVLFLMRPITILEWVIIGSVYTTVNVLLYGITFINYEKIQNVLRAYSNGGI